MLVGLFCKKFRRTFQKSGKRSLLGGQSLAGSWRNQSSSLVGSMRLAALGKPTVAKKRRTLMGQSLGGGSVTWGHQHSGPSGCWEEREPEFLPEGKKGCVVGDVLPLQSTLQFCLSWTVLAKTLDSSAASFPTMLHKFFKAVLASLSVFHF